MQLETKKVIFSIYLLFLLSAVIIYKLPSAVGALFQIFLLIFFWRSKKDYFWLAFVFIVEANPGGLFFMGDPQNTFSLIQNSPLGNLYFWFVFTLIALIKSMNRKPVSKLFLSTNFTMLFVYLGLLLVAFGVYRMVPVVKLLVPWLYLFILPRMLRNMDEYAGFFRLIMAFVPFVILTQFYSIVFGGTIGTALGGVSNEAISYLSIEETQSALRPVDGIFIPFLAILGSIMFLTFSQHYFRKNYLTVTLALSLLSIFITATRSWMLASILIIICYNLIIAKNPIKTLFRYLLPAPIILVIALQIPFLQKQIQLSWERYETVEYLAKGDITAGGTLQRFDVRGPRVMKHFKESPILGWGFGAEGREYADGHVGHQNLLMQTGIIGYMLFLLLWINFILKMWQTYKYFPLNHPFKELPLVLIIYFLGIHVINVSAQWFNYLVSYNAGFILCLLFTMGSLLYREAFGKGLSYSYQSKNIIYHTING